MLVNMPGATRNQYASAARTALAVTGTQALTANTHYTLAATTGAVTLTLPAQSSSTEGDFITIIITADMGAVLLKLGTSGEDFALGSMVEGADTTARSGLLDFAIAGDDFLNVTGHATGDGAPGSYYHLFFDGSNWSVNAKMFAQGAGSTTSTVAFGAT